MRQIQIGNKSVGNGNPCFVIVDAGSNHDGKLEQAKHLIDIAFKAGADAVKFQIFSAKYLAKKNDKDYQLIEKITFPKRWLNELTNYYKQKNIMFLATPFDIDAVDLLDNAGIEAFKVASGDITFYPMLERIAKKHKPVMIATGKLYMQEVEDTLEFLRKKGTEDIVVFHCVASYPSLIDEMNLSVISVMKKKLGLPVGLSDHSTSTVVPALAVALGANLIEKHFTIDKTLKGPDHSYALEPNKIAFENVSKNAEIKLEKSFNCDVFEIPLPDKSIDLVFTNGVLIHIAPEDLKTAMSEIVRVSKKYVLCSEYFFPEPITIDYRKEKDLLFKRDFGKYYLENFPELKLVSYGFLWREELKSFDNLNWWLFEKDVK